MYATSRLNTLPGFRHSGARHLTQNDKGAELQKFENAAILSSGFQSTGDRKISQKKGIVQLVSIEAHVVAMVLLWCASGLILMHIASMLAWYEDLLPIDNWLYISFFDLDEEESLGTWFSSLILFLASLLSLFQARYPGSATERWHLCWWVLGVGFCILSLDEIAGFHEFVNTIVEDTHWTTYGAILVLAVGIFLIPFIVALPARTRALFLVAGAIYVGGAIGVEWATLWHEENDKLDTLGYNLWNAVEEGMEMVGVILYIYALLAHIENNREGATLQLEFGRATAESGEQGRFWT